MQVRVRHLFRGEIDHELIWLGVSFASLALAGVWLTMGLPWPRCVFHDLTSLPCVTCGMTRCGIQFFHAHFVTAFRWNPLVFIGLSSVMLFDFYALFVLVTRAPRLRISFHTQMARTFARVILLASLALNWIYLLIHYRAFA